MTPSDGGSLKVKLALDSAGLAVDGSSEGGSRMIVLRGLSTVRRSNDESAELPDEAAVCGTNFGNAPTTLAVVAGEVVGGLFDAGSGFADFSGTASAAVDGARSAAGENENARKKIGASPADFMGQQRETKHSGRPDFSLSCDCCAIPAGKIVVGFPFRFVDRFPVRLIMYIAKAQSVRYGLFFGSYPKPLDRMYVSVAARLI